MLKMVLTLPNNKGFLCLLSSALTVATSACFAFNGLSMHDDPDLPLNWYIDQSQQKVLDHQAYLDKLINLREKLEAIVAAERAEPQTVLDARKTLLEVYRSLNDLPKANSTAEQLEATNYDDAWWLVLNYYRQTKNYPAALRILSRRANIEIASGSPSGAISWLIEAGDLQFRRKEIDKAEKFYKEAVDIGLKCDAKSGISQSNSTGNRPVQVRAVPLQAYAMFLASTGRVKESANVMDKALDTHISGCPIMGEEDGSNFRVLVLNCIKSKDATLYKHFVARYQKLGPAPACVSLTNAEGKAITGPVFLSISRFNEGLAAARDKETGRVGFIDETGAWQIKPQFLTAAPFAHGLAPVKVLPENSPRTYEGPTVLYSLINREGKVVAELPVSVLKSFNGLVGFGSTNRVYDRAPLDMFDKTGEVLVNGVRQQIAALADEEFLLPIEAGMKKSGCRESEVGYLIKGKVTADTSRAGHFKLVQSALPDTPASGIRPIEDMVSLFQYMEKLQGESESISKNDVGLSKPTVPDTN